MAEYNLESRGNETGGSIGLFGFDPYASMLINTIHVTELVARTTYIAEPAVTYVPMTIYATE